MSPVSADPFAAVLGTHRGHPPSESDSIFSLHPTGRAKEELQTLRRSLEGSWPDLTEAFAVLAAMADSEEHRPLERRVRDMLARCLAKRAEAQTRHIVSRLLSDAKIHDRSLSEHIVSVQGDSLLHLWVDGHLHKSPTDAPCVLLLCNRQVPGDQVGRKMRGKWRAPSSSPMNSDAWRCRTCEEALLVARKKSTISLPNMERLFAKVDDPKVIERLNGEVYERQARLTALPKQAAARQEKYLVRLTKDRLLVDPSTDGEEREVLTRAECLVSSLDTVAHELRDATFQIGWLRRLGLKVTPAMETLMPLLSKEDVAELLRALYPPAYHKERDWRELGDSASWQEWLDSPGYQEALAGLVTATQARLKTRRRTAKRS